MTSTAAGTLAKVAGSVLAEVASLVDRIVDEIATELPELASDVQAQELLVSTVRENLVTALQVFGGATHSVDVGAPPVALEFARRLAQRRVSITTMLRAYRLGQAAFQQEMITRIAAEPVSTGDVAVAATELSSVAFSYIDKISEEVVEAYQRERDTWLRHRNANRLAKVQAALAGTAGDVGEIENILGYVLSPRHVGAVLWSGPEIAEAARLDSLERHAALLATALGAAGTPLVVAPDASTVWAWFSTASINLDLVTSTLAASPDPVRVALGDPASGLEGFRATHHRARQTQAVAQLADRTHPRPVTAASQLGPLALIAADPATVAGWVQSVLGALADDDEPHERMRETVWAYLSSGSSLMLAAQELHLHKNTIQYRLRKAEQARGRALSDGRIDLEVALLAWRLLGAAVLRPLGTAAR